MGGVETSRGIAYQNAQAVLAALEVLNNDTLSGIRIEGTDDILDIEVHRVAGGLAAGKQIKTRVPTKPWGKGPILDALHRWLDMNIADAEFEFVTDGLLGPSAIALRDALDNAGDGDLQPLAHFLDVDATDPRLPQLARTRVRQDVTGAEAVLAIAEREVRSLLPGARTAHDLKSAAKSAVDALLRELASRAGSSDEADRVLTTEQISEVLGGVRGIPISDRWPRVGAEYRTTVAAAISDLVEPTLHDDSALPDSPGLPVRDLLNNGTVVLLSGRTGCGKSSATQVATQQGSAAGQTVIRGHAEAYVAGHLAAFVADALSEVVGRALPTVTGHQALADREVILLIDGASEIPVPMREGLSEELRPILTSATAARVVLVGRDRAVLGTMVPTTVEPRRLTVLLFDHVQRAAIVRRDPDVLAMLEGRSKDAQDRIVADLIHAVKRPLGDAAGNPMLFAMGLQAVVAGEEFNTDAALYATTVTRLAERAGMADIDLTCAALGIVFARLLDNGRRFVYPHEYRRLLDGAAAQLAAVYFEASPELLASNIAKSGLLAPLGAGQVMVPVHDSFADYFAGIAHAQGLTDLPERLTPGDERRLEFTAEAGGLTAHLVDKVARDLPFHTVSLASHDLRRLTDPDAPARVASVTRLLLAPSDGRSPVLARVGDQVLAALVSRVNHGWLDPAQFAELTQGSPRVVLNPGDSPLTAAVRLWRTVLLVRLRSASGLPSRRPTTAEDAARLLRIHLEERRDVVHDLISSVAPPRHREALQAALGPLGLTATITSETTQPHSREFPMVYEPAEAIAINVSPVDHDTLLSQMRGTCDRFGSTSVDSFLRVTPRADAEALIRKAIESLTEAGWLQ